MVMFGRSKGVSLLVLLSIAVLPSPINDYVEFKGGRDRASVKILQSSTRTARDRVIEEEISKAALGRVCI